MKINRSFIRKYALVFGLWTLIGLSFAGQFFIASSQLGRPVSWNMALSHSLADWYVFAILSGLPIFLGQKFGLDHERWGRKACLHLLAGGVFSLFFVVLRSGVAVIQGHGTGQEVDYLSAFNTLLIKTWHFNFLIYWVILSIQHAVEFYRRYQERAASSAELERHLVEARLMALQMQLNPHFLFNTLHAISSLMWDDVDAADRMITRLSELLRRALDSTHRHLVPLDQEIDFLEKYLEIEKIRFGKRLEVKIETEPETLSMHVPNLILQPLVENALKYGIEPFSHPGLLSIVTSIRTNQLHLEICDTGRPKASTRFEEGIGLSNTRSRLEELFPDRFEMKVLPDPTKGTCIHITIPCMPTDNNP